MRACIASCALLLAACATVPHSMPSASANRAAISAPLHETDFAGRPVWPMRAAQANDVVVIGTESDAAMAGKEWLVIMCIAIAIALTGATVVVVHI